MILYLSGTGNTKYVAEKLAAALGDRAVDVTTIPADGGFMLELEKGEKLGFCFPVHGWRPPQLMRKFVHRLTVRTETSSEEMYTFAVCTAGDTIGEAVDVFISDAAKSGIKVKAAFDVKMPNTYVGLPFMDVDGKEVESEKIKASAERLTFVSTAIKKKAEGLFLNYIGKWPRINSRFLGSLFVRKLVTDRYFRVDETACVKCGKCAAVCPVADIIYIKGEYPQWKHNKKCMTCFACYHSCKKHAIQYGWMTRGKGQYQFPVNR